MSLDDRPFWERKRLDEMSRDEWERLCDGCAKCCLVKLEFEDTGELELTMVACRLLDAETCRCTSYAERHLAVDDCVVLTPEKIAKIAWLPQTCAYRLLARGQPLPPWHPLITGDPESVHLAGMSVRGRTISEDVVNDDDFEDYLLEG